MRQSEVASWYHQLPEREGSAMAKNIVFCADGTWNGPGQSDTKLAERQWTNVFKIFLNLDGLDAARTALFADEQERELIVDGDLVQIAKYLHGVGDSQNFIVRALGGGLGEGLIARIVRGYTFISRNYEVGDKIYVIGFSRGAYTARAPRGVNFGQGVAVAGPRHRGRQERRLPQRLRGVVRVAPRNSRPHTGRAGPLSGIRQGPAAFPV
jgi:hypothetical protein